MRGVRRTHRLERAVAEVAVRAAELRESLTLESSILRVVGAEYVEVMEAGIQDARAIRHIAESDLRSSSATA